MKQEIIISCLHILPVIAAFLLFALLLLLFYENAEKIFLNTYQEFTGFLKEKGKTASGITAQRTGLSEMVRCITMENGYGRHPILHCVLYWHLQVEWDCAIFHRDTECLGQWFFHAARVAGLPI